MTYVAFTNTYCSQCGGEFGPGDTGFSHCDQHEGMTNFDAPIEAPNLKDTLCLVGAMLHAGYAEAAGFVIADALTKAGDFGAVPSDFRAGFIMCREYMARFVEQGGDKTTAQSIRANWLPLLGEDPAASKATPANKGART